MATTFKSSEEEQEIVNWGWAIKLIFWGGLSMILVIIGIEKVCHIVAVRHGMDTEQEFLYLLQIQPYLILPTTVLICGVFYATISIFHRKWKQALREFFTGGVAALFVFLMFLAWF